MTSHRGVVVRSGRVKFVIQVMGSTGVTSSCHASYDGAWFCCTAWAAFARTGAKYAWLIASCAVNRSLLLLAVFRYDSLTPYLMIISKQLVQKVNCLRTDESLILGVDEAVPILPWEPP